MSSETVCRICGNQENNISWRLTELLFCTGESFDYFECAACGCLQIKTIPDALANYYPQEYFAFKRYDKLARPSLRGVFDRARVRHALDRPNLTGVIAQYFAKPLDYVTWASLAGVKPRARVLDVGCGGGKVLLRMRLGGFESCQGVDPFIPETLHYRNGVVVHKCTLEELKNRGELFGLIMLHHSLEHMPDQLQAMRGVEGLLSEGGAVVIRVPVASSYAWEHYREHWVSLDPPRHLYLHTHQSMHKLAEQVEMQVVSQYCDATPSTLLWSELHRRNNVSRLSGKQGRVAVTTEEHAEFERLCSEANQSMRGDQAVYVLKRVGQR